MRRCHRGMQTYHNLLVTPPVMLVPPVTTII